MTDMMSQASAALLMKKSRYRDYEAELAAIFDDLKWPYVRELVFAPPRRYRFDFAFPKHRVAVECEGAIWIKGRHTTGKGFHADCCKYNLAVAAGWRVIRLTSEHFKDTSEIVELICEVLNG